MRILTPRTFAVAVALPLALSALAACGSDSSSTSTAISTPAAGSTPTSGSGSTAGAGSTPTSGSSVSSADFVTLMQAAARKVTTAKVSMTMDVSGDNFTMKGAMDLTGDKPAMQITMDMTAAGLSGVEMRLVDGTIYMNMGSMTGDKFVKFDLSDPNSPLGSLSSSLDQLNPAKMMAEMSPGTFSHVTYLGTDQNGRHYRAIMITAKAPQLAGLPKSATANLPKKMAYDVWLDSEGRFSKFRVLIPNMGTMSATYSDYGADVNITAPDPSDVTQMPNGYPSS
jgi:hypothetical protein